MNHCRVQKFSDIGYGSAPQYLGLKVFISQSSPKSENVIPCHQHRNVQISTLALQVSITNVGVLPSNISVTETNTILKIFSENYLIFLIYIDNAIMFRMLC
jgi:hypothetical protein